ncbi:MAG TPA: hypothetical protein VNA87_04790 [Actinomycetota bacterium]|nr:hypothetical protein [Actinomycetota bacterium]
MAIDERSRHGLYRKLEQVLGPDEATTLMEHLPPVGWADVATKYDLEQLRVATKHDLEQLTSHFESHLELAIQASAHAMTASFRGELLSLQRHMVFAMSGSMVSVVALAFAAAQLF